MLFCQAHQVDCRGISEWRLVPIVVVETESAIRWCWRLLVLWWSALVSATLEASALVLVGEPLVAWLPL